MRAKIKILISMPVLCIVLVGVYLACSLFSNNSVNQNTKIAVVVKTMDRTAFWQVIRDGATVAAQEFGVQTKIVGTMSEMDIAGQIKILEELIVEKPDAIVLAATDYNELVPVATKIKNAGIKLITIDSGINSDIPECFIATDNIEAGRKAAQQLVSLLEENSEVALVGYVRGATTATERERGIREVLTRHGINTIHGTFFSDGDPERAYTIAKQLLSENPKIKGMIGFNENSTLGIAKAIKEMGLSGKVKLVGFDNSIEEIKLIEQGVIQATIVQNPFNMGYRGVEMAVKALEGDEISKRIDTYSAVVTRENMYIDENQKLLFPFVSK